jgi:Family of unknown function (DUF5995)
MGSGQDGVLCGRSGRAISDDSTDGQSPTCHDYRESRRKGVRMVRRVDDVIERMLEIESMLPRRDGIAVFNGVYRQMSEQLRDRMRAGFFRDPPFMERFGVNFAGLYLDAVDAAVAGAEIARPWEPLAAARRRRGVAPAQFALAGMNAHINHDLAIAVVTTCGRMRREPVTMHDDYERINDVIASIVRPIRQSFLDSLVVEAGAPLSPLADLVSNWSIDKARDAAWVHARTLWQLRDVRSLTGAYRRTLGRTVGLISRQLLVT